MSDPTLTGGIIADPSIGGDLADPTIAAGTVDRQGPPGPPGLQGVTGATGPSGRPAPQPQAFQILGASSISAVHGLAYVPAVRITDAIGDEVETDLIHSPGQVTAVFPGPFTGTLTVG